MSSSLNRGRPGERTATDAEVLAVLAAELRAVLALGPAGRIVQSRDATTIDCPTLAALLEGPLS